METCKNLKSVASFTVKLHNEKQKKISMFKENILNSESFTTNRKQVDTNTLVHPDDISFLSITYKLY